MKEAEGVICKVLEELSNPESSGTTCTPAALAQRIDMCLKAVDNAAANFSLYNDDSTGTSYVIIMVFPHGFPLILFTKIRVPSHQGLCLFHWLTGHFFSTDIGKALSSLPSLSHALGEVMLQGLATSNIASNEESKESKQAYSTCLDDELLFFFGVQK